MSHDIKIKQKVYGLGENLTEGSDYCGPDMEIEKREDNNDEK
jgi:hypothetical protein